MSFIIKTYKTLRSHWKKSTFGFVVLTYAGNSFKTNYETKSFMRACCEEAAKYGDETLPVSRSPRSITIILNPAANKRRAKTEYEKYCDPLFHLAGIGVNLVQTNFEGHAKELVETLPENDAIIVAGGDGTLLETLTGILRKDERDCKRTVGVLPLGQINYFGSQLFPQPNKLSKVRQLTDATMAIIKNETQTQDVMKIEVIEDNTEAPGKPIYAIGHIEWGAFRDAFVKRDKYWFYGGLRNYATYIFNGYKNSLSWDCKGTLKFTPPCSGCNNCRLPQVKKKGSWLDIVLPKVESNAINYSKILNENCSAFDELCFKSTEMNIVPKRSTSDSTPYLSVILGKMNISYIDFVSEGWKRIKKGLPEDVKDIKVRTVELLPLNASKPGSESFFNIDNEEFEVKSIKITLLPNAISIFRKQINTNA